MLIIFGWGETRSVSLCPFGTFALYIPNQFIAILVAHRKRLHLGAPRHIQLAHHVAGLLLQVRLQLLLLSGLRGAHQFLGGAVDQVVVFLLQLLVGSGVVTAGGQQPFGWATGQMGTGGGGGSGGRCRSAAA